MLKDHYVTLGLHRDASAEEIHEAFRVLALKYHPDLNADDRESEKRFEEIQAAFEVLSDPKRRAAYNRTSLSFTTTRQPPEPGEPVAVPGPTRHRLDGRQPFGSALEATVWLLVTLPTLVLLCMEYIVAEAEWHGMHIAPWLPVVIAILLFCGITFTGRLWRIAPWTIVWLSLALSTLLFLCLVLRLAGW